MDNASATISTEIKQELGIVRNPSSSYSKKRMKRISQRVLLSVINDLASKEILKATVIEDKFSFY
jgi:hypothetical protein